MKTMSAFKTVICSVVAVTLVNTVVCNSVKWWTSSTNCSDSQFFNTNQMACESCVSPQLYYNEFIHQMKLQIRSTDGFSCVCRPGFRPKDMTNFATGRPNLFCIDDTIDCPNGSKPMNGFQCAYCLSNQKTDNDSLDVCRCPKGHRLVERVNKSDDNVIELSCERCHKHFTVTSDGKSCKACHQSYIKAADGCVCPPKTHVEEDGMCLPEKMLIKKDNLNTLSMIELEDRNKRFISDFLYRRSRPAVYNCKYESNRTACQLLANLCLLYHYSYSDETSVDSNICKIANSLTEKSINPEIYYKGYYKNELQQNSVPNRFKINDRLQLIASRFAISGQLIDYSDLETKELQLCYENEKSSQSGYVFNTNFRQRCVRTTRDLWDNYQPKNVFFELYLKDVNNNGIVLYPIPVLIRNIKRNDQFVNHHINGYDTNEELHHLVVLTHRFYLIDSITGVEKSSDDSNVDYQRMEAKFLRIAKSVQIDVRLRKQDGSGSIYPPLITISYETLYLSDYQKNTEIELELTINYSMDDTKSKRDLSITIGVLCCAALLWSIFRTWCWAKRNGKIAIDFITIVEFFINTIGVISNVFFFVNIFSAINTFLMFKNQSVIHTLLLTRDQEYSLIIYIMIALKLKAIHLLYKLLSIATIDIFFIDWERPKKRDMSSMVAITRQKSASTLNDNESDDKHTADRQMRPNSSAGISLSDSLTSPTPKPMADKLEFPNVTVWRTNFVANEWMELCGHRRLSLSIHILLVILVLDWFGFANLALSDANNSLRSDESQRYVPQSMTCRLSIGALVYGVLALINIAFKKFIYETLINNKLHQFVDLCSVCNISLFAMRYKRFGYYIHGLAANGKSDVNMLEMYELLEREENDLCSKRGLLPNSDHQTFEMSLPSAIDEHYQRFRSNLSGFVKISDRMRSFGTQLSKADSEKLIATYLMINKFLSGFVEHNFKDVDYIVREKSTLESVLDVEFIDTRDKGFFYSDNGHSFEAILFYGLEFTLLCYEMMLFLVTDLFCQSFTFSAILTFIASNCIRKLYLYISRRNLIRKALLDQRFLI